jgi:hypothetical protein
MNNDKKKQEQGDDPKGRSRTAITEQTNRFNQQQGPVANAMAMNYGRASEANYGDYTDIMNNYRDIASGGAGSYADVLGGGGGGGGGGFSAFTVSPGRAGYSDPFKSYGGFEEFSRTGGFSEGDIANMRARGVSPVRAAYANAEREIGRQRALQGGYAPNAIAAQVKMAREQGQSAADAIQNVEAGIAQQRQQGRLAGLGGMSNIEGQRLSADVDVSKFNTGLDYQGQVYNADAAARAQAANASAGESAANRALQARGADMDDRFRALSGMTNMYGTTPGMSNMYGNQVLNAVGLGGQFGQGVMQNTINAERQPGQWEQNMGRTNDIMDIFNAGTGMVNAWRRPSSTQNSDYVRNQVRDVESRMRGGG